MYIQPLVLKNDTKYKCVPVITIDYLCVLVCYGDSTNPDYWTSCSEDSFTGYGHLFSRPVGHQECERHCSKVVLKWNCLANGYVPVFVCLI